MADRLEPFILKFGGGINRRPRAYDINPEECFTGENFDLSQQFAALFRRKPFDLAGTAPAAQEIRGAAQLIKRDGTVSSLIQSGGNVYSWDGASSFTLVGNVSAGSKLRGFRNQNFTLDNVVIITDLNKESVVKTWDGSTFADLAHNLSSPLYAKFCLVVAERAIFGNVRSGTDTPHVLLASKISDKSTLTITGRPSSSLGEGDAFFLPIKDLKPINGLAEIFGQIIVSTQRGRIHTLTGHSSQDYEILSLYEGSAISGDEAMASIGNDLAMGLSGRIELLTDTDKFGDTQADDASLPIESLISSVRDWKITYNPVVQKVFFFPDGGGKVWVFNKSIRASSQLSPWSQWTTSHSIDFSPSTVWTMVNPNTLMESTYMGDQSGNIYRLEGNGGQDGGTADITVNRRSVVIRLPEGRIFDGEGWIIYDKAFAQTITLTIEFSGTGDVDQPVTITLPASGAIAVYNDSAYYNDTAYYNAGFTGRLARQNFSFAGNGYQAQVLITATGSTDFQVHELGFKLRAAEA